MSGPLVLGVDPSLRHTGWALVELVPGGGHDVVAMGVVVTKKSSRKKGIRVADDDHRCVEELALALVDVVEGHRVTAVCAEAPGGFKGSRATKTAALAHATVGTLAVARWGVPLLQATANDIKVAAAGKGNATKAEVIASVRQLCSQSAGILRFLETAKPKLHEHAFDAVGAVIACEPSQAIQMARKLGGVAA